MKAFLFLRGGWEEGAGDTSVPWLCSKWGIFTYTPFVHSNCKGAWYCFPFQTTRWVAFVLHEVIKERKLSPFPSWFCFACVSHYRCRGHGMNVSKTGGNK